MWDRIRRWAVVPVGLSLATLGVMTAAQSASHGNAAGRAVVFHPSIAEYYQLTASTTPPTETQCNSVGRSCFSPQDVQGAYNLPKLYQNGFTGKGETIAIIDSFGSDTIASDLHVYDQAFGLQPMCGEADVTCASGMPTFSQLHLQGSPPTNSPPPNKGTGQENHTLWDLEVSLDVETSHAIAPQANILLVTTPTAETLGVQGFPDMMNAEQYVVDHHLADVISQSFGSAEQAFGSTQSLLNLRHAFISAAQNGVTVLASSGDNGTANIVKQPTKNPATIPFPTVGWPASDPLVTGVGGTYLCTVATGTANGAPSTRTIDPASPAGRCHANPSQEEVGWTFSGGGFSSVFSRPSYQDSLPAKSTPIGSMRGVPDVAFQASAGTGALVFISLPPDGQSGLLCGPPTNPVPCSTGWYDIGGTSLACPQWAGLVAIADQINGHDLGLINPALYKIGSDPTRYAADFFDVVTGNNTITSTTVSGYPATQGWDPVTGLGTPNAATLLPDLVNAANGH